MSSTILDYKELVDSYVKATDWRVKENSTVTYSVGGLILSNSGAITANYWLSEIYDEEIANAHRSGDIHLHDLSMLTGYCAGWSLRQLIQEGLGGIPGKITSAPAKPSGDALQSNGQLPRHHAERMGRAHRRFPRLTPIWRRLSRSTTSAYRRGQKVHRIVYLRRQHPQPLGYAGAILQHYARLDGSGRPRRTDRPSSAARKWISNTKTASTKWTWSTRPSSKIMIAGRCQRPRFPVPDPDLFHHQGFRLV